MKLIKTDRRHRLSSEHMNDMMLIRIQSPKVQEFDRTPSIDKWMAIFTHYVIFFLFSLYFYLPHHSHFLFPIYFITLSINAFFIRIQSSKVQEFDRTPSIDKWMAIFTHYVIIFLFSKMFYFKYL